MLCLTTRYAERTNKGEVVVKHGVEDGWGTGCKTIVQLPPGVENGTLWHDVIFAIFIDRSP